MLSPGKPKVLFFDSTLETVLPSLQFTRNGLLGHAYQLIYTGESCGYPPPFY